MMTTDKKLAFLHKMTKLGLDSIPHFETGGQVVNPSAAAPAASTALSGPAAATTAGGATNPNSGVLGTIAGGIGLTNGYQAGAAPIQQGTNTAQLQGAYTGAQGALTDQAGLVGQTQPGVTQGLGAQNTLSGQLANEAAGQGPNPAQMALNQSTGQNIASQAALAASTRGASSNAGLIASQNAQAGAATQQQAVGQAATLQAQQQLAAQQEQQQLAATQVSEGSGAIQNENQMQQNEQNILQGANTSSNNAAVSSQGSINSTNASTAQSNQQANSNLFGGLLSGGASAISAIFAAHGGLVQAPQKMAQGGYMAPTPLVVGQSGAPQSFAGQWMNSQSNAAGGISGGPAGGAAAPNITGYGDQADDLGDALGSIRSKPNTSNETAGGAADVNDQPDTGIPMINQINPTEKAAYGGKMKKPLPMMGGKQPSMKLMKGGKVKPGKGEEAVDNHDDYANDKVPAMLSAGEVVMDKDTLNDPGPIGQMARQVAHHIQMRNQKGKKSRV